MPRNTSVSPGCRLPGEAISAAEKRSRSGPLRSGCLRSLLPAACIALFCVLLCTGGCGSGGVPTPAGAVVGRFGRYDYSPSVIQVGEVQQFWWCGQAQNPNVSSQNTDAILYESIDLTTGKRVSPQVVLAETPGAWDSAYTCNPKVVQGTFSNPLGDGATYTYAMYYVGTSDQENTNNNIGAAFSNDGIHWKKYLSPVIRSSSLAGYGPAQPVPFNADGKQSIWVFYEDDSPPLGPNHHTQAVSTDGVHFTDVGTLTTHGLNIPPSLASWGDMAYNPADGYWYAAFNLPPRSPRTTANMLESVALGIQLYRIPENDLLAGKVGWELLQTIDTNLTGYEVTFLAGLLRDPHGNLFSDGAGTVQMFPAFSNRQTSWNDSPAAAAAAASVSLWDIGHYTWSPADSSLSELKRFNNGTAHLVTTGPVDPQANFLLEKTLGRMYTRPQGTAVALYGCKAGTTDAFLSLDGGCEGERVIGINGFLCPQPVAGVLLTALYRCKTSHDHFASTDPGCEGSTTEQLLGYILPA